MAGPCIEQNDRGEPDEYRAEAGVVAGAWSRWQQALDTFQDLADRIDGLELDIYYAARSGHPSSLNIRQAWADIEQCYRDGFEQLKCYLFVKGQSHVTQQGFPLDTDEVGTAASQALQKVWDRHACGLTVDAAHILNLADTILWKGDEQWRSSKHQLGILPRLWEMAMKKNARRQTEISTAAPLHPGAEDDTRTMGEGLKDEQADTPQATEMAGELQSWDQQLAEKSRDAAARVQEHRLRTEEKQAEALTKQPEALTKQARALMGLRLFLRQQLMYLATHYQVTERFFDQLFDDLSQLLVEDARWEERLNQAIAEHPIESLTTAERLATTNLQVFRIPLYKKSDRGFELDKDASEFLQHTVFGKTGKDQQNNLNRILMRNIVLPLDDFRQQFHVCDLFGIRDKAEALRERGRQQEPQATEQANLLAACLVCWDERLKELATTEERAVNLLLRALRRYIRRQILNSVVAQAAKPDAAQYYLQEVDEDTIENLPLARLLSPGILPHGFTIPLYSENRDRERVLHSEAAQFFTDVLAWPPEQVQQQIESIVPRLDAIGHQCGADIWGIAARAIERQNAEGGERR